MHIFYLAVFENGLIMKVKCIKNDALSIRKIAYKNYIFESEDFKLINGLEYTVYSVIQYLEYPSYALCYDGSIESLLLFPSNFFEITDNRMSRYWIFSLENDLERDQKNILLSFPEWVNDPHFFEDLRYNDVNGINSLIFKRYKQKMDLEFPDLSVTKTAGIGDDKWLICPDCIDAWENSSGLDALVECPSCRQIMKNPRYII